MSFALTEGDGTLTLDTLHMRLSRMHRGILTGARLLSDQWEHVRHSALMVTLTYRPGVKWEPFHIATYTDALRKWLRRRGSDGCYLWVMETTQAGVPHYHVVVWLKRGLFVPKADKRGWWPHGMTRTEVARCPVAYLAKYASKGFEHRLPRGARISGCAGLDEVNRRERCWWLLPAYARSAFDKSEDVIRAAGGGFVSRTSGAVVASAWLLVSVGRGTVRLRCRGPDLVRDVPPAHVVSGAGSVRVDVRDVFEKSATDFCSGDAAARFQHVQP